MATNNAINANSVTPMPTVNGGTGVSSPTAHGIVVAEGASAMVSLVLAAGQIPIGTTSGDPAAAAINSGTGIVVANSSGSITISATGGGVAWSTIAGTTQAAAVDNGYIIGNAGQTTVTLPATAAIGSRIQLMGSPTGVAGWILAANTGQTIKIGSATTSSAGSLTSANQLDNVSVVCIVANTTWMVSSVISAGLTIA